MLLLTGGSACGKSFYGESLAVRFSQPRYYIATMRPYGAESEARIDRHRRMRQGKGFETLERYTDLAGLVLPQSGTALLECICNLAANEMFAQDGTEREAFDPVVQGVLSLKTQCDTLIVVTNDVGSDSGRYADSTRRYIRTVGRINAALAREADAVYELVCGIPLVQKGKLI